MERKYSIEEIDRMRSAIKARLYALEAGGRTNFMSFRDVARPRIVEDQLRTHMLNGTEPDELVSAAKAAGA